jgi:hypothetical protein
VFFPVPPPEDKDPPGAGGKAPERPQTDSAAAGDLPDEPELRAFIGPNADYYLRTWKPALTGEGSVGGFNWAALIFGPVWLLYRRMYWHGLAVYAILIAGAAIDASMPPDPIRNESKPVIGTLLAAGVGLVGALWGNAWYLGYARRALVHHRGRELARPKRLAAMTRAGGTNVGGALAGGALISLFAYVLVAALFSTLHF